MQVTWLAVAAWENISDAKTGGFSLTQDPARPFFHLKALQRLLSSPSFDIPATAEFGEVRVDFARMEATFNDQPVGLTAHEFKMLKLFVQNAERVISRGEILSQVFGYEGDPHTRTVDTHILRLDKRAWGECRRGWNAKDLIALTPPLAVEPQGAGHPQSLAHRTRKDGEPAASAAGDLQYLYGRPDRTYGRVLSPPRPEGKNQEENHVSQDRKVGFLVNPHSLLEPLPDRSDGSGRRTGEKSGQACADADCDGLSAKG
jgi:hypothetical protein